MNNEIDISTEHALTQAGYTAETYLNSAIHILSEKEVKYTTQDAIALAHIMALDFNATIKHIKMQEIRDSLDGLTSISNSLDDIKELMVNIERNKLGKE